MYSTMYSYSASFVKQVSEVTHVSGVTPIHLTAVASFSSSGKEGLVQSHVILFHYVIQRGRCHGMSDSPPTVSPQSLSPKGE